MKKEFKLSDKINQVFKRYTAGYVPSKAMKFQKDVLKVNKEFIQRIEMTMLVTPSPMEKGEFILWLKKEIDNLSGDLK